MKNIVAIIALTMIGCGDVSQSEIIQKYYDTKFTSDTPECKSFTGWMYSLEKEDEVTIEMAMAGVSPTKLYGTEESGAFSVYGSVSFTNDEKETIHGNSSFIGKFTETGAEGTLTYTSPYVMGKDCVMTGVMVERK